MSTSSNDWQSWSLKQHLVHKHININTCWYTSNIVQSSRIIMTTHDNWIENGTTWSLKVMNFPSDELRSLRQRRRAGEKGGHKGTVFLRRERLDKNNQKHIYQYSQAKTAPTCICDHMCSFFHLKQSTSLPLQVMCLGQETFQGVHGTSATWWQWKFSNGSTWQLNSMEAN